LRSCAAVTRAFTEAGEGANAAHASGWRKQGLVAGGQPSTAQGQPPGGYQGSSQAARPHLITPYMPARSLALPDGTGGGGEPPCTPGASANQPGTCSAAAAMGGHGMGQERAERPGHGCTGSLPPGHGAGRAAVLRAAEPSARAPAPPGPSQLQASCSMHAPHAPGTP
jgi:hypothetical protein